YDQADKVYQSVLAADPDNVDVLWNLAVLYHRNLNKYDDAIAIYTKYKGAAPPGDDKAGEVDKLVAGIQKVKSDQKAQQERADREKKKAEAIEAACAAVRENKKPAAEAIGNDSERSEVAWQLVVNAQGAMQNNDIPGGEALMKCALAIIPET